MTANSVAAVRERVADVPLREGEVWYGGFMSGRTAHIGQADADIVSSEILCGITGIVWPDSFVTDHPRTPVCKRCLKKRAALPDGTGEGS